MATEECALNMILRVKTEMVEMFHCHVDIILNDMDTWGLITKEEYFLLNESLDRREKLATLLNIVTRSGESACQTLLNSLEDVNYCLSDLGPVLSNLELATTLCKCKTMATEECALNMILRLKTEMVEILHCHVDIILNDMDTWGLITKEEYFLLNESLDRREKLATLLNIVTRSGESACQTLLNSLEDVNYCLSDLGPVLSNLQQPEKTNELDEILSQLDLKRYRDKRLTLREILETGPEDGEHFQCLTLQDVPWHFLNKLLALNMTARNTCLVLNSVDEQADKEDSKEFDIGTFDDENLSVKSYNPLDVLCALLHCTDSFLQQEILFKMAICQFALPLVLPPCDGTKCTFLLWAMRDIVKKWRPHSLTDSKGFREESLALISMPTISFVRLGRRRLSKSKILNEVLSPAQQHHDTFIHWDMKSGNFPRRLSDGLVEISWYFPGGREYSDLFPEPVAFANLRGDIESHWPQFSFLTEVSSAVFIYVEDISKKEFELLSSLKPQNNCYFIFHCHSAQSKITLKNINKLTQYVNVRQSRILKKDTSMNDATFAAKLQSMILKLMKHSPKVVTLEEMAVTARELGIRVDEDCDECQNAMECAKQITENIEDVAEYKKEMMKLQGEPWKKLAKIEKEFCRLKRQGKTHTEDYKCQLNKELSELRAEQNKCDLTDGMINFLNGIRHLPKVEKHYFIKWMKFGLDAIARKNLSSLREKYKEKSKDSTSDPKELAQLDKAISEHSLGVEHFMREMGQFYESECSMKEKDHRQFTQLPGIAADLMLEGFPLELIDGDASNIPLQWVTDVLTELDKKLKGQCRLMVMAVLGVQSTGKSTLLNTMFGLQFAVSSGRCTRGAFMLLMKVKEKHREDLGCDFILVIDTEGLKAPELMTLEDSYEHDNELATLVVGLSDITIINMAMENATEMKDILQIVVHSFLRMESVGKTPNCQFVHQNVSDISAHDQNMRDRKNLLDQMDKMTKAAAKMEKQNKEITFSDIMEYDPDKHNWYIPGLWHGVPPMAPVNLGYSEKVLELKKYLFEFIRERTQKGDAMKIPQFKEWVKSLWNAVKHENFIFSFRNSLVAEAYNQLSSEYSRWEWAFRKDIHLWVTSKETAIQNHSSAELNKNMFQKLEAEASQKLLTGEKNIINTLEKYFESGVENLNLIEKYREDFIKSTKGLMNELEIYSKRRWHEAIQIQKGRQKLKDLQHVYIKIFEDKVVKLLDECRMKHSQLGDEELKKEFEDMWGQTLSELQLIHLEKCQVAKDMYLQLIKDLNNRGSAVNQMVQTAKSLKCGREEFILKEEHFERSKIFKMLEYLRINKKLRQIFGSEYWNKTEDLVASLTDVCSKYVREKVNSKADYDENFCRELLNTINEELQGSDTLKLCISPRFEVDLKLHILGRAAKEFQAMHEEYIIENDPRLSLDKVKPQYFSTFKDLYLQKDQCQKSAQNFCDLCLKPALKDYIMNRLGLEIVDDILSSGQSEKYCSRMFFQFTVLEELLRKRNFEDYVEYTIHYKDFVKKWIWNHILDCYQGNNRLDTLEQNVLGAIIKNISGTISSLENSSNTVADFLENVCHSLREQLVISQEKLRAVSFQNKSNLKQFSKDVLDFLTEMEQSILSEFKSCNVPEIFSALSFKPQDELFKKVFGCGVQCPFCKVSCVAGGSEHQEHFAETHRPQGLGRMRNLLSEKLDYSLCSSDVASTLRFSNSDTKGEFVPYSDYRKFYPNWKIQPDPSISASLYWKFIFKEFNKQLAQKYHAEPADLPEDWENLTENQALKSIQEAFNMTS
ncbi:interferon-induced very large GTPase 1-like [Lissotriton helveticus]